MSELIKTLARWLIALGLIVSGAMWLLAPGAA